MRIPISIFFVICFYLCAGNQIIFAQSEVPTTEIGVNYTMLRYSEFNVSDSGIGSRLTFNLTNSLAIEGEFNFFPEKRRHFSDSFYINSRRYQGVFGAKYGVRRDSIGTFVKIRPGFIRFGEGLLDPSIQTVLPLPNTFQSTEFVLDYGGILELYTSHHTMLRFDLGDTVIFFGNSEEGNIRSFTSHNIQLTAGFGFRF